jgi:hypothetical protein
MVKKMSTKVSKPIPKSKICGECAFFSEKIEYHEGKIYGVCTFPYEILWKNTVQEAGTWNDNNCNIPHIWIPDPNDPQQLIYKKLTEREMYFKYFLLGFRLGKEEIIHILEKFISLDVKKKETDLQTLFDKTY